MTIPENATYTAAEVKVLTEAALRLGRAEAAEEIATAIEKRRDAAARSRGGWEQYARSAYGYMTDAAEVARSIGSLPPLDPSSARTGLSVDTDLPPEPQAGSKRLPDNTGLEEDCGCIYAPGLGDHITMLCREGHMPGGPR